MRVEDFIMIPQAFYAQHGPMSEPGPYGTKLRHLPQHLGDLAQVVQGLILHICWADGYGVKVPPERQSDLLIRKVPSMLDRLIELKAAPFNVPREPAQRFVGNCRNFALLLCAILREQGIPARVRVGFATYFTPDFNEDHWICEYWESNSMRWIRVDAQLDEHQCRQLNISFDPLDLPAGVFISGGEAWQLCRSGQADPNLFGLPDDDAGWEFLMGNVVRDFLALNKIEILPWDGWGWMEKQAAEYTDDERELLDHTARLTINPDEHFAAISSLYQEEFRFRPPEKLLAAP